MLFMEIINIDDSFHFNSGIAATIGFFDGVHSGHRFLLSQLKSLASLNNLPASVITFPEHPKLILQTGFKPDLLTTLNEKIQQLESTGIDYCFLLNFSQSVSQTSAEEFIQNFLRKQLNVRLLLIGYDHRFGKNRAEGFEDYVKYGEECGMKVIRASELPNTEMPVSSTSIRNKLLNGYLEEANKMLSYNYPIEGIVVAGNKLGRQIGFPTANLELTDKNKVIPSDGIYAAWVYIGDNIYHGMAYIGTRPTVTSEGNRRIEVHILDFTGDLYGKTIRLELVKLLREDQHFNNLEELKRQLIIDKENTIKTLL